MRRWKSCATTRAAAKSRCSAPRSSNCGGTTKQPGARCPPTSNSRRQRRKIHHEGTKNTKKGINERGRSLSRKCVARRPSLVHEITSLDVVVARLSRPTTKSLAFFKSESLAFFVFFVFFVPSWWSLDLEVG